MECVAAAAWQQQQTPCGRMNASMLTRQYCQASSKESLPVRPRRINISEENTAAKWPQIVCREDPSMQM